VVRKDKDSSGQYVEGVQFTKQLLQLSDILGKGPQQPCRRCEVDDAKSASSISSIQPINSPRWAT